jgi:hypothetical protein
MKIQTSKNEWPPANITINVSTMLPLLSVVSSTAANISESLAKTQLWPNVSE